MSGQDEERHLCPGKRSRIIATASKGFSYLASGLLLWIREPLGASSSICTNCGTHRTHLTAPMSQLCASQMHGWHPLDIQRRLWISTLSSRDRNRNPPGKIYVCGGVVCCLLLSTKVVEDNLLRIAQCATTLCRRDRSITQSKFMN